ncbi:NAD(P)-dependent oxidoreductase [Paraburkholderia sp. JHI869]|uniref:NAD(P)-dependent oxidoreductase n=1 Tax=Paraburkholderia sp. JHI869 TaxID=3112959 RepID=UPI00316D30DA
MEVGFIGLGRMGQGMARNLLKGGVSLTVFDANSEAASKLVEAGAKQAKSVAELARTAHVVFTSLPGPAEIEEVVLGANGILNNMTPGLVLFDLSTSSLSLNRRIEQAFREKGGSMLDAPISGGPTGAASGDLAVWVSGDRKVFEEHQSLLQNIGDKVRYVGPIGAGTVAKLAHNVVAYMILESMAEVFSMGVKAGVDPLELWEALRLGSAGKQSPLMLLVKQFLPAKYEPASFALKLAHKDVMLATALGRELGVPMRLANLTLEEMTEAVGRGWGEQDARACLKIQLERAGVNIAVDPDRLEKAINAEQH